MVPSIPLWLVPIVGDALPSKVKRKNKSKKGDKSFSDLPFAPGFSDLYDEQEEHNTLQVETAKMKTVVQETLENASLYYRCSMNVLTLLLLSVTPHPIYLKSCHN
jgi:hypothetical protein